MIPQGTPVIPRLFQAMEELGLFGVSPYSEIASVTVTNSQHITIAIRSEKALRVIAEALEAASEKAAL